MRANGKPELRAGKVDVWGKSPNHHFTFTTTEKGRLTAQPISGWGKKLTPPPRFLCFEGRGPTVVLRDYLRRKKEGLVGYIDSNFWGLIEKGATERKKPIGLSAGRDSPPLDGNVKKVVGRLERQGKL